MRLKAALICPISSDDVTGSRALSPRRAIFPAAAVSSVTGALMRRAIQAASARATAAISAPPSAVVASMARRNPCRSVTRNSRSTST